MILSIIQIIISIALTVVILLQQPNEGGLGSSFGGGNGGGGVARSRRGWQKILFRLTVVLAVLFLLASFLGLII